MPPWTMERMWFPAWMQYIGFGAELPGAKPHEKGDFSECEEEE